MLLSFGPSRTPAPTTGTYSCGLLRRGRRPRRPAIGANIPTFHTISGSGASAETILHFMPLAKFPAVWHAPQQPETCGARLGSQETLVSCGVLWVLSFAGERKYLAEGHSPRGVGDAAPYGGWKGLPRSAAAGHMGPALQISIENRPLERGKGPAAVLRGLFFSIRGCLGIFSDRVDQSWKSGVER